MHLVTYCKKRVPDAEPRAGALIGQSVVDVNAANRELPSDVLGLIQGGSAFLERAREAVVDASERADSSVVRSLAELVLLAPIPRPPKIVCIGVNYADHAAEAGRTVPARASVFMKAPSTVIGPGEDIIRPITTEQLDYEVELAVVIGRTAKAVARELALEHVAGYTIMNDVSARDLQLAKDGGVILGKNFDEF